MRYGRHLKPIVKFIIALILIITAYAILISGVDDIVKAEVSYAHIQDIVSE